MDPSVSLTLRDAHHSQHAFSHAPAALRIFRFAADSATRVLEITHVSEFLRECAVEFGSADATVPAAMRNEYAARRYFWLRDIVECNAARCPWLAEKLLAGRSAAPIPAAALAPDVTRHDVNWGAEGARRDRKLIRLTHGGFGLLRGDPGTWRCVQGAVCVTSGRHHFQVSITNPGNGLVMVGFVDDKVADGDYVGRAGSLSAGAMYYMAGSFHFGTGPAASKVRAPANRQCCAIGCLLDLAATPAHMTVFVDGTPLAVQCEYDFPKDGRAWFPSVCVSPEAVLHSCAM
jgi:hypothetical protein